MATHEELTESIEVLREIEYWQAETDHAIATAKAVINAWDLGKPDQLLEALQLLREYVEENAPWTRRALPVEGAR
jgi:hypothetical protein